MSYQQSKNKDDAVVYEQVVDDDDDQQEEKTHVSQPQKVNNSQILSSPIKNQKYQQQEAQNSSGQGRRAAINTQQEDIATEQQQPQRYNSPKKSGITNNEKQSKPDEQQEDQYNGQDGENITIGIVSTEKRGGSLTAYWSYTINGEDEKGTFNVSRRFNEFFEMRTALVSRWPGCFVPSVPSKNMFKKNDADLVEKRKRYLNEFLKKMAKLPHLYYGEEFQALLRLEESDISSTFSKWTSLTTQSIINKYRINFAELAGKQLNMDTNQKVNEFINFIKRNQSQLEKDRESMVKLAEAADKLKYYYSNLFNKVFPAYERTCLAEYCGNNASDMLYLNESEAKLNEHSNIARQSTRENPYWLLYDMIRNEERDGLAFLEAYEAKLKYESKLKSIEEEISSNQKNISDLSQGKKNIATITKKGTNDQIKYKYQSENEELRREKQNVLIMVDIISALIAYIEIKRYKLQKRTFYRNAVKKIGRDQLASVQSLSEIWSGVQQATLKKLY